MSKRIETPRPIRGTQDMYGQQAAQFEHVVDTFQRVRKLYRFKRIEMPMFEATAVFTRSLGETSDVVGKEMYIFEDKGGDSLTLRPEFTAGICRAYITGGWQQHGVMKLATHGPLFRYERPQKGRFRQFHQLDAEVIGAAEPTADVELLVMADHLLRELGISNGVTLKLNTLGDAASREAWRAGLVQHFDAHRDVLSDESQSRLERNPLRILDSKDPRDIAIAAIAPDIDAYLTEQARGFFESVTGGLDAAGVAWTRDARLVRGLDYYRHTAFEFVPVAGSALAERLGSQSTILGGGRYDGLIENLGGPATPAVGWAAGIERLAMLGEALDDEPPAVVVVAEDDELNQLARTLTFTLRRGGFNVDAITSGSRNKRFDRAKKQNPALALILNATLLKDNQIANVRLKEFNLHKIGNQNISNAALSFFSEAYNLDGSHWFEGAELTLFPKNESR